MNPGTTTSFLKNMKQITKTIKEVVLEEGDFGLISKCLEYVKHRKIKHGKCEHIEQTKLQKLINDMYHCSK